jgi:DNA-binding XRE family transcriptional regulator
VDELRRLWGRNIAARRKQLRLTQLELAKAVGVTQQTISAIEHGQHGPGDALKVRLVQHLGDGRVTGRDLFPLESGRRRKRKPKRSARKTTNGPRTRR